MDSKYPTLILIVLTLSAGCIGTVDPSQPTTEASTYCETDLPTAHPELSHEKEPPTYNEELSPQEATDFVHQFEENLTWNRYYSENIDKLEVDYSNTTLKKTEQGYVVQISEVRIRTFDSRNATGDYAWSVSYYLMADKVLRAENNAWKVPDPKEGRVVSCK